VSQLLGLNRFILSDSLPAMELRTQSQIQLPSRCHKVCKRVWWSGSAIQSNIVPPTVQLWLAPLSASLYVQFADPSVTIKMSSLFLPLYCTPWATDNGCHRFYWGSVLSNWTMVGSLKNILVPTLVINGIHDIAQDFIVQPFSDNTSSSSPRATPRCGGGTGSLHDSSRRIFGVRTPVDFLDPLFSRV
jgi:hypothetical protein